MTNHPVDESTDGADEDQLPTCTTGCCCGFEGRGGKVRLVVMIVAAVVTLALLVHGFAG